MIKSSQIWIFKMHSPNIRAHFKWGLGSKYRGSNLDSFEANWTFELDLALNPSLHLGSSNHEFSFWVFFRFEPIDFLSKSLQCRFSLNLPLFGLGPLSKCHGSNYLWLSSSRIALFHWTLSLAPSSKVMVNAMFFYGFCNFYTQKQKFGDCIALHCLKP